MPENFDFSRYTSKEADLLLHKPDALMDAHAELWCRSACAPSQGYEAQDSLLTAVLQS